MSVSSLVPQGNEPYTCAPTTPTASTVNSGLWLWTSQYCSVCSRLACRRSACPTSGLQLAEAGNPFVGTVVGELHRSRVRQGQVGWRGNPQPAEKREDRLLIAGGEFLVDDAEWLDPAGGEELTNGGVLSFRLPHQSGDAVIVEGQLSGLQGLVPQSPGASQLRHVPPLVLSPDAGLAGFEPGNRLTHFVFSRHPDEMQVREESIEDLRQR